MVPGFAALNYQSAPFLTKTDQQNQMANALSRILSVLQVFNICLRKRELLFAIKRPYCKLKLRRNGAGEYWPMGRVITCPNECRAVIFLVYIYIDKNTENYLFNSNDYKKNRCVVRVMRTE